MRNHYTFDADSDIRQAIRDAHAGNHESVSAHLLAAERKLQQARRDRSAADYGDQTPAPANHDEELREYGGSGALRARDRALGRSVDEYA